MVLQLCELVPTGAMVMSAICLSSLTRPLKVDEEVWLELIRRKYTGRYHNIDQPLREALGLPLREQDPVKNYSDEGLYNGRSTGISKKMPVPCRHYNQRVPARSFAAEENKLSPCKV